MHEQTSERVSTKYSTNPRAGADEATKNKSTFLDSMMHIINN